MNSENDSLIEFPCNFPIKAMGLNHAEFAPLVLAIIDRHAAGKAPHEVHQRPSSNAKYLSVTITIEAHSRAQLDAIYRDLTAEARVLMAL